MPKTCLHNACAFYIPYGLGTSSHLCKVFSHILRIQFQSIACMPSFKRVKPIHIYTPLCYETPPKTGRPHRQGLWYSAMNKHALVKTFESFVCTYVKMANHNGMSQWYHNVVYMYKKIYEQSNTPKVRLLRRRGSVSKNCIRLETCRRPYQ